MSRRARRWPMKFWKAARRWWKPGGVLVFAVCSLEREEGEEQIEAFLEAHPEFARVPLTADEMFGHSEWITPDGDLRTLPCHLSEQGGMDGFYARASKRLQAEAFLRCDRLSHATDSSA